MPGVVRRSGELLVRHDDLPVDGAELLLLDRSLAEEGGRGGLRSRIPPFSRVRSPNLPLLPNTQANLGLRW
jgi:hypothetical protein